MRSLKEAINRFSNARVAVLGDIMLDRYTFGDVERIFQEASVPVVAIFGPTHPGYNPPLGDQHTVLWAGAPCSPCYNPDELAETIPLVGKKLFTCWLGTHECMKAVTVEDAYAAVKERLTATKDMTR